jgi:hypothetical protein
LIARCAFRARRVADESGDEVFGNRGRVPPIGVKYTRIVNPYLFCRLFSPSEAPRLAVSFDEHVLRSAYLNSRFIRKGHIMFDSKMTRRGFATVAATAAGAAGLLGASANSASAYQGNMERALGSLHQALGELRQATANKGGHRARAMELVNQAIAETQAGVEFADEHGGG